MVRTHCCQLGVQDNSYYSDSIILSNFSIDNTMYPIFYGIYFTVNDSLKSLGHRVERFLYLIAQNMPPKRFVPIWLTPSLFLGLDFLNTSIEIILLYIGLKCKKKMP